MTADVGPLGGEALARSAAQQRAIASCDTDGIHVVRAGAGVGKSFTIVELLVPRLLAQGHRVLVSSFTRRATANLGALDGLRRAYPGQLTIATTQGFFFGQYRKRHPERRWVSTTEAALRLASLRADPHGQVLHHARVSVEQAADGGSPPEAISRELLARFEAYKATRGLYDGSNVREWLAREVEELARDLAADGLDVYIGDEVPDSDPIERRFIEALAEAGVEVYLVGDPCQTLYMSLRTADPLWFSRLVRSGVAHEHCMTVNRRSLAEPLRTANEFTVRWLRDYGGQPMWGVRPGGRGLEGLELSGQGEVLSALQRAAIAVTGLSRAAKATEDVGAAAPDLAHTLGLPRRIGPGETVLILTARDHDTKLIAEAIGRTGLEVQALRRGDNSRGNRRLAVALALVDPEGTAVRSLGVQARPADAVCLLLGELARGKAIGVPRSGNEAVAQVLDDLAAQAQYASALPAVIRVASRLVADVADRESLAPWAKACSDFLDRWPELLERWRRRGDLAGARNLLGYGLPLLGIGALVADGTDRDLDGEAKRRPPNFWTTLIARAGRSPGELAHAILHAVVAHSEADDLPGSQHDRALVYVGTVFQLKGLEADYVVIASLDTGRFPHKENDTPEGRFVWYVALTRAKRSLGYALAPGNGLYLPAS